MNEPQLPATGPQQVALAAGWTSLRDFIEWTQADPDGVKLWEQKLPAIQSGAAQGSPGLLEAAARFAAFRKQDRALRAAREKSLEIARLMSLPPAGTEEERFIRLKTLCDELSDVLLDAPEPQRTQFMQKITRLRERMEKGI